MSQVTVAWETHFPTFWAEGAALAAEEYTEIVRTDPRVEPHLPNVELLELMHRQFLLHIVGARVNGELGGFLTWTIENNPESQGYRIVRMGAMYVRPKWSKLSLSYRMFKFSHSEFSSILAPIRLICHRPSYGRGIALGILFQRFGLHPSAVEFSSFLEPPNA